MSHQALTAGRGKTPLRSVRSARLAALGAWLLAMAWTTSASAYVPYRTEGGVEFAWPGTCVFITGYVGDFTGMPAEEVHNAVTGAATAWSKDGDPCTYLSFNVTFAPGPAPARVLPGDRRNVVIFRTKTWCLLEEDGTCHPTDLNYSPEALALTTVNAGVTTGTIRDVDIEVNAVRNEWADIVAHPELATENVHDLQNALTHEFGHLIGLEHTCFPAGIDLPTPVDHEGREIPFCGPGAPAEVQETTMYNSAPRGESEKRTLAADDQLAVCSIYPAAQDPGVCAPDAGEDPGCGCAAGGRDDPAAGLGLALALLAAGVMPLAVRRRGTR